MQKSNRSFVASLAYSILIYVPVLLAGIGFLGQSKFTRLTDYLQHQFPLRKWAYQHNALLQVKWLGNTSTGNVHFGRGPWIFYITQSDGNSFADLMGSPTAGAADAWQVYLEQSKQKPFGFNAKYVFVLVPNKESVYPENLSYLFLGDRDRAGANYFTVLKNIPADASHLVVPMLEPLLKNKVTFPTYYQNDTHWNNWGAYIGHLEILKAVSTVIGEEIKPLEIETPFINGEGRGDILAMIADAVEILSYHAKPGQDVRVQFVHPCCATPVIDEGRYQVFENRNAAKIVWLVGDSFSDALRPLLAPYFRKIAFIKNLKGRGDLQSALRDTGSPDLIIEETVERYLANRPTYSDFSN